MHHLQDLETNPTNNFVTITNPANYIMEFNNAFFLLIWLIYLLEVSCMDSYNAHDNYI